MTVYDEIKKGAFRLEDVIRILLLCTGSACEFLKIVCIDSQSASRVQTRVKPTYQTRGGLNGSIQHQF
jgi:hypothetical protein